MFRKRVNQLFRRYGRVSLSLPLKFLLIEHLTSRTGLQEEKRGFLLLQAASYASGTMRMKLYKRAITAFQKALQSESSSSKSLRFRYLIAELFHRRKQYKKAIPLYKRALRQAKDAKLKRWLRARLTRATRKQAEQKSVDCRKIRPTLRHLTTLATRRVFACIKTSCKPARTRCQRELTTRADRLIKQQYIAGRRYARRPFLRGIRRLLSSSSSQQRDIGYDLIDRMGPRARPLIPFLRRHITRLPKEDFVPLFRAIFYMGQPASKKLFALLCQQHKRFPDGSNASLSRLSELAADLGDAAIPTLAKLARLQRSELDSVLQDALVRLPKSRRAFAFLKRLIRNAKDPEFKRETLKVMRRYWPRYKAVAGICRNRHIRSLLMRVYLTSRSGFQRCQYSSVSRCPVPLFSRMVRLRRYRREWAVQLRAALQGKQSAPRTAALRLLITWRDTRQEWLSMIQKGLPTWRGTSRILAAGYLLQAGRPQQSIRVLRSFLRSSSIKGALAARYLVQHKASQKQALTYFRTHLAANNAQWLLAGLAIAGQIGSKGKTLCKHIAPLFRFPRSSVRLEALRTAVLFRCHRHVLVSRLAHELLAVTNNREVARIFALMGPRARKAIPVLMWALQLRNGHRYEHFDYVRTILKIAPHIAHKMGRLPEMITYGEDGKLWRIIRKLKRLVKYQKKN
jgi:tetratricopeptide (TPR) repeat protein